MIGTNTAISSKKMAYLYQIREEGVREKRCRPKNLPSLFKGVGVFIGWNGSQVAKSLKSQKKQNNYIQCVLIMNE